MLTITIPLKRFIDAVIGARPNAIIDTVDADLIRATEGHERLCVIENNPATVGFDTVTLPQLRQGLWRLWYLNDWTVSDNKRQFAVATIELAHTERRQRYEAVVAHFVKMGINYIIAVGIVEQMGAATVETTYQSIQPKI